MYTGNAPPSFFALKQMIKDDQYPKGDICWCDQLKFGSQKNEHPALLIRDYLGKKLVLPCTSNDKNKKIFFLLNDVRVKWYHTRNKNSYASHLPEHVPLDSFRAKIGHLKKQGQAEFRVWVSNDFRNVPI